RHVGDEQPHGAQVDHRLDRGLFLLRRNAVGRLDRAAVLHHLGGRDRRYRRLLPSAWSARSMITYVEKGYGLHQAVAAAGHSLMQFDREWVSDDDTAVQALIDGYTLDQAQAARCAEVSALAKALRERVISSYSPGEMASWSIKRDEAAQFAATQDGAHCPML